MLVASKIVLPHIAGLTCLTLSLDITLLTKKAANAAFFNNAGCIARLFFSLCVDDYSASSIGFEPRLIIATSSPVKVPAACFKVTTDWIKS